MKLFVMVGFIIGVFLVGSSLVLADENHSNGESHHEEESQVNTQHEDHATTGNKESHKEEMDHSKMTEEEHQESIKNEDNEHGSVGHEQENSHSEEGVVHEEAEGGNGHGGANLVEKPENMKVLGTFGAINLSFILIGIWNKWFKRKEEE